MSEHLEPGWLERAFEQNRREVAALPDWMRFKMEGKRMAGQGDNLTHEERQMPHTAIVSVEELAKALAHRDNRIAALEKALHSAEEAQWQHDNDALWHLRNDQLMKIIERGYNRLEDENVAAKQRIAELEQQLASATTTAMTAEEGWNIANERIDVLEAALRAVEWAGYAFDAWYCPRCLNTMSEGHTPDCIIGNALKEGGAA